MSFSISALISLYVMLTEILKAIAMSGLFGALAPDYLTFGG